MGCAAARKLGTTITDPLQSAAAISGCILSRRYYWFPSAYWSTSGPPPSMGAISQGKSTQSCYKSDTTLLRFQWSLSQGRSGGNYLLLLSTLTTCPLLARPQSCH